MFVLLVCFCVCVLAGAVMAVIEIVRDPSKYSVKKSFDEVPEDYLSPVSTSEAAPEADPVPESVIKKDELIIG